MKPAELKEEFIKLRAEGRSYNAIAEQLHLSKHTCQAWEAELAGEIGELKRAKLAELCESYNIAKEARIKTLGGILEKIDEALAAADFSKMPLDKLLDHKLKYMELLKDEYISIKPACKIEKPDANGALAALNDLLARVRAGEVTAEQAQKELAVLSQLLKAYEQAELKKQLDELTAIVGGRK